VESAAVIYGTDLQKFLAKTKNPLADSVDPTGINVIESSIFTNDTDVRAIMLVKEVNKVDPTEATLDFDIKSFMAIVHHIEVNVISPSIN